MQEDFKGIGDYLAILRRRKWHFLLPAVAVMIIAVSAALSLPATYRSSATILIEEPDVPRELVRSTITSFADQRVQVITQRVMATQNLADIIRQYGLYGESTATMPLNKLVGAMRKNIRMELISAEVIDPRTGRPSQATIAFTLSFDHGQPDVAQRIANELVSLYLNENIRERRQKAAETTEFLAGEAERLQREILEIETKLADFKRLHAGSLPEQLEYNLQVVERTERELRDLDRQAQNLAERQIYLDSELAQVSPFSSLVGDRQQMLDPRDQLRALRMQFISVSARYGPEHPDVVQLRREVMALEKEVGGGVDVTTLREEAVKIQAELSLARERYSENHPDVVGLQRELYSVEAQLADASARDLGANDSVTPNNPAYIQLRAQLEATRSELRAIEEQRRAVRSKLERYEDLANRAPLVEREYLALRRDHENASIKYDEIRDKQRAAQLGEALETERRGERFSLIEPPLLPLEPIKPNRRAIVMLGFVLSLGIGAGITAVTEAMDTAVHGPRQVAAITGVAPLVIIPHVRTRAEILRAWRNRTLAAAGLLLVLAAPLTFVHYRVVQLDVVWLGLEHRLEKTLGVQLSQPFK